MLVNIFKTALRAVRKNKLLAIINFTGLAVGMTCFLLFTLYVRNELRFDRCHRNYTRIHRVIRSYSGEQGRQDMLVAATPAPLAATMAAEFPEVGGAATIRDVSGTFRLGDRALRADGLFADAAFLGMFDFPLVEGNPGDLGRPGAVFISETAAAKFFGSEDPMGRVIAFNKQKKMGSLRSRDEYYDLVVRGILMDVPEHSHLRFDYLISIATLFSADEGRSTAADWGASDFYSYVLLPETFNVDAMSATLAEYTPRFRGNDPGRYILQPLRDIHWRPGIYAEIPGNLPTGRLRLALFSALALVTLLIAGINSTNLAASRLACRAGEFGVRKFAGARRGQLVRQLLGESLVMSAAASAAAAGLSAALLPVFSAYTERKIPVFSGGVLLPVAVIFALALLTGLLTGLYPALFMTSLSASQLMKRSPVKSPRGTGLRRLFIVLQFGASVFLVASTLGIEAQLRYIRNRDPGYEKNHVVVVPLQDRNARSHIDAVRAELLGNPKIVGVAGSDFVPLEINNVFILDFVGSDGEKKNLQTYSCGVDEDFLNVFGLELEAGRFFSRSFATDRREAVVLNRRAAELTGWRDPIGRVVDRSGRKVVGVIRDYHHSSLHDRIEPMVFFLKPGDIQFLAVRIQPGYPADSLAFIKTVVEKYSPAFEFEYYFQDDYIASKYKADVKFGEGFIFFAALALLIAGLGLLGIASFTLRQRTKEIGIRRVLGASVSEIFLLLGGDMLRGILLSNLIAWPAAFFFLHGWLENFAYRTSPGVGVFLLSGAAALGAAVLAVGGHTLKASLADPAESLRYE